MVETTILELKTGLNTGDRLLGIDMGTKTIGLAMSDITRTIATPLETIRRTKFGVDVERMRDIVNEHGIAGFVLGLPMNMDGSEGPRCQSTRAFAENLLGKIDLPLAFWDERMSTQAVTRTLIEADVTRKGRKQVVDKMAAAFILQGALDAY